MPALAHVAPDYRHYAKSAEPRGMLAVPGAELKFYHLERPGEPIAADIAASARGAIADAAAGGTAGFDGDLGFVILHRCGAAFHFLLLAVWRGSNEAWEAVWYRDGGMGGFAPFDPAYPPSAGALRPTFCVWELGIVAHESLAWSRFLASSRAEADLALWREDRFRGRV